MSEQIFAPINYYSARSLMRLFDACYKMGVRDAIEVGDVPTCLEFCDRMYAPECFGRVIYDYKYSWREWKFRLSQILYEGDSQTMLPKRGLKFFDCISGYKTYLACALPIAMDFYLWGIKDYCKYPNKDNLVKFEAKGYNLWGQKVKKVAMDVFVRKVVEFCYDREKIDAVAIEERARVKEQAEKGKAGRKAKDAKFVVMPTGLSTMSYRNFQQEIWRNTRVKEYKTRGR